MVADRTTSLSAAEPEQVPTKGAINCARRNGDTCARGRADPLHFQQGLSRVHTKHFFIQLSGMDFLRTQLHDQLLPSDNAFAPPGFGSARLGAKTLALASLPWSLSLWIGLWIVPLSFAQLQYGIVRITPNSASQRGSRQARNITLRRLQCDLTKDHRFFGRTRKALRSAVLTLSHFGRKANQVLLVPLFRIRQQRTDPFV